MAVSIIRKRFAIRCPKCQLDLEYYAEDVLFDKTNGAHIICPVCNSPVTHNPDNEILPPPPVEKPVKHGPVDPGNPYSEY
ncbi:MAG: hypothetical protein J6A47_00755 [Bacilli bacterium]|nr:hypothetical protein [Bacilli bacterium]